MKKTEDIPKWSPSREDVAAMRENLKTIKQVEIGGHLRTPAEQYAKTMGVIYFDEKGNIVICKPLDYRVLMETYDKMKAIDWHKNEEYMQTHPEERSALMEKIKSLGASLKI